MPKREASLRVCCFVIFSRLKLIPTETAKASIARAKAIEITIKKFMLSYKGISLYQKQKREKIRKRRALYFW